MARPAKKATGGTRAPAKAKAGARRTGRTPLTGPPLGSYDPALDYQLRASQRGLADLVETTRKESQRSRADFRTGRRLSRRQLGRDIFDLGLGLRQGEQDTAFEREGLDLSFSRSLQDLAEARQRGEEDYDRTLANLQREYAAQEFVQAQNAVAQGVDRGGGAAASATIRGANQAYDRQAIDTEHARALEDLARTEDRTRVDYGRDLRALDVNLARLVEQVGQQRQRSRQDFGAEARIDRRTFRRGMADRSEKLSRARREQGLYEPSVIEQMYFQAHQYNPKIRFPRPAALGSPMPGARGPRSPRRGRRPGAGGVTAPRRRVR